MIILYRCCCCCYYIVIAVRIACWQRARTTRPRAHLTRFSRQRGLCALRGEKYKLPSLLNNILLLLSSSLLLLHALPVDSFCRVPLLSAARRNIISHNAHTSRNTRRIAYATHIGPNRVFRIRPSTYDVRMIAATDEISDKERTVRVVVSVAYIIV